MKRDGVWYFHKFVKGKREFLGRRTPFSLETRDLVVAKAKRDTLLKAASGSEVERVLGKPSVKVASLAQLVEAYLGADWPKEITRKRNVRYLLLILRRAKGAEPKLEELTVADLTGDVVQDYQDWVVKNARAAGHGDDSEEMLRARFTANRTLAHARSIFANEKPFRKLHVPRPAGFLEADLFKIKRDMAYRPMSDAQMAVFADESKKIMDSRQGVYLAYLCMRWLGMRNSEVEHVKPSEWVQETPRGRVMQITNRGYFLVKGVGSIRSVPVPAWLWEEIHALAGGREWLIPGNTITDRHEVVYYHLNEWMAEVTRAAIEDGRLPKTTEIRTAYDLRKQAGSELYRQTHNILAVSKWLGHQNVHTTTKWYVNLIDDLPSLGQII